MFRPLIVAASLLVAGVAPALAQAPAVQTAAQNPAAAQAFIKSLSDRAFAVLRDKSLSQTARETRFRQLLSEGFNLDYVGNFVLGPGRRTASEAQLKDFQSVFPDYVIRIYANRLTDYSDSTVRIVGTQPAGTRGDLLVRTQVSGPKVTQPVQADWRVRNFPGQGLQIIDLAIANVSMASTQREEFQAIIQDPRRGMNGLINQMRQQSAAGTARPAGSRP
jgi:phospholipid transport system substrate-binding protein